MGAMMHLARKWRSQTFQSVCGQSLVIRILQNNLYRGYFFPVYLCAGPRGSGKTSTARIFAAAVNCDELHAFHQDPHRVTVPCHACASCQSLFAGSHPDIVEIDAASYTGVDNVRAIIDSATFLPVMGRKKVYIIDEAHMLSKAACNAFLKILEEPPEGAIFILATTDANKILTTVKSRSLQLYFTHVDTSTLQTHIEHVCQSEEITYESAGVSRLVQAAEGSVRDALQILERVYLAYEHITRDAVIATLGEVDEQTVFAILEKLIREDVQTTMDFIKQLPLEQYTPMGVWSRLLEGLRALFWGHYGSVDAVWQQIEGFYDLVHMYDEATIYAVLERMYAYEAYLYKTTHPQAMCEMLIYDIKRIIDEKKRIHSVPAQKAEHAPAQQTAARHEPQEASQNALFSSMDAHTLWNTIVERFQEEGDPLLASVFHQAYRVAWDDSQRLHVVFARELQFYHDWMCHHIKALQDIAQRVVQITPEIAFVFEAVSNQHKPASPSPANGAQRESASDQNGTESAAGEQRDTAKKKRTRPNRTHGSVTYESITNIDDPEAWPFAHAVLQAFPGSIKRVKKR